MSGDWALVFRGFAVAGIGACATILYIVGISAAYIGRFTLSIAAIAIGAVFAFAFLRLIGPYLDAIDQRETAETSQMKARVGAAGAMETSSAETT